MHRYTGPAPGIMVWGGIGYHSRTPLVRIAGTLNSQRYISEVLELVVLLYLQGLAIAIFQHNNKAKKDFDDDHREEITDFVQSISGFQEYDEDVESWMACDAEDRGFHMLNDDEIVTSVREESNPVDDETDEDEDNNVSCKGPRVARNLCSKVVRRGAKSSKM
ncbi:uncharacterized protein TNCV_2225421 [Trichonephila clavipes]|nr:uncharacterized protein TNCV_2225421 [Trichonephila clavipes]